METNTIKVDKLDIEGGRPGVVSETEPEYMRLED